MKKTRFTPCAVFCSTERKTVIKMMSTVPLPKPIEPITPEKNEPKSVSICIYPTAILKPAQSMKTENRVCKNEFLSFESKSVPKIAPGKPNSTNGAASLRVK